MSDLPYLGSGSFESHRGPHDFHSANYLSVLVWGVCQLDSLFSLLVNWGSFLWITTELWLQRSAKLLIHKELAACMSCRVKSQAGMHIPEYVLVQDLRGKEKMLANTSYRLQN